MCYKKSIEIRERSPIGSKRHRGREKGKKEKGEERGRLIFSPLLFMEAHAHAHTMVDDVRFSVTTFREIRQFPSHEGPSVHPVFDRIEFVQPVGIPRENTKSDATRRGG